MPNYYTNVIVAVGGYDFDVEAFNERVKEGMLKLVHPMPEATAKTTSGSANIQTYDENGDDWYSWALREWGTKWGDFDVKAHAAKTGDGSPLVITFQTAWGPPHEEACRKIGAWLAAEYELGPIYFTGYDPGGGGYAINTIFDVEAEP